MGDAKFQYRKRYEVTCDCAFGYLPKMQSAVSIPQAV